MGKAKHLIIVDDETGLARAVARYIRQQIPRIADPDVCTIHAFEHPDEVLDLLRILGPDISVFLITDGHMPSMNGDELIATIQKIHANVLSDVYLTSGHAVFNELARSLVVEFMHGKATDPKHWRRIKPAIEAFLIR